MSSPATISSSRGLRIYRGLGYAVSIACLVWVLYDFHLGKAIDELAKVNWEWVAFGIALDIVSYVVQGMRWKLLLAPFGRISLRDAVRAVYAGLFANIIFPLRPGEILRSFLVSKSEDIGVFTVLSSVGIERLIDLVVIVVALAVTSLFVPLPERFRRAADGVGIAALVLVALFVALILYLEFRYGRDPNTMAGRKRIPGKVMSALISLHTMGTSPSFYPAVLTSLLMPFFQILALWAVMKSYGLGLPFFAAIVVLLVINLGVSLPNAPANVGSYQFFCVLGLSIFQVEKTTAAAFSIFAFLMLTLPFLILGFFAVLRSGLSFRSMREQVNRLPSQVRSSRA